ncbi:hypothetical protein MCUN1_001175 [Malassezia cuniculi]|uniref:Uncharacterized protein n=1 Tax=Malassezia cuniculi TaxID=948313 RepID=A0AAF0JAI4_9BASI|nr:hypothetical protein MCUN1_001175 [Malassezia cuniculi]
MGPSTRVGYADKNALTRRKAFDEIDTANITTVLRENPEPWNVSHLARVLAKRFPRHPYHSYQTYLQKNLYDNRMLRLLVRQNNTEPVQVRTQPRQLPSGMVMRERRIPSQTPSYSRGVSEELVSAEVAMHEVEEEDEEDQLAEDEQEEEEELVNEQVVRGATQETRGTPQRTQTARPLGQSAEAEVIEVDEAEVLHYERQRRSTTEIVKLVAPRSLYERRSAHPPFTREEKEGLCEMLAVLIDTAVYSDNELLACPAAHPGVEFWEAVAEAFPVHSSAAWRAHFESHKLELLHSARQVARPEDAQHRLADDATTDNDDEADAAAVLGAIIDDTRDVSSSSDVSAELAAPSEVTFLSDAPLASYVTTPSHITPRHKNGRFPATTTPRSPADVNQRLEHHKAKVSARAEHMSPDEEESSPTAALPIRHAWRDAPGDRTEPVIRARTSVTRDVLSSPLLGDDDAADSLPRPWLNDKPERRLSRSRAAYRAQVWELCERFGFVGPSQLKDFMVAANGDPDECALRVQQYLEDTADYYGVTTTKVCELLRVLRGDISQLFNTLDLMNV